MAKSEMTGLEYRKAIADFVKPIGIKAKVFTSLRDDGPLFMASLYCRGMAARNSELDFTVLADSFAGLFKELTNKWSEYSEKHRVTTIRKMALAIIRITADFGECTDAALRNCGEFDPGQIMIYGEQACSDANDIAGRGPFSIIVKGGANAEVAA